MNVYALIGPSGTGKSYRALYVSSLLSAEYILDDGILISGNKIIEGKSAKLEKTMIGATKAALFENKKRRSDMIRAIKENKVASLLILATSEKMAKKISNALELGEIKKFIDINDVSTEQEIERAKNQRALGMHTVPLPTFEIKKAFSGLFLKKLKIFVGGKTPETDFEETKSVVRPTFSYFGEFHIKEKAITDIITYSAEKNPAVEKINKVSISKTATGIIINLTVCLNLDKQIISAGEEIIKTVTHEVEHLTSINVDDFYLEVKDVI